MTAQGELRGRATMGDWQEDVVEAHELADGRTMTVKRHQAETDEQWHHRLMVLAADVDEMCRLRGQHTAAASNEHRDTFIPTECVCGTCRTDAFRLVNHEGDGMLLSGWTHYRRGLAEGHDHDEHEVVPTFPAGQPA